MKLVLSLALLFFAQTLEAATCTGASDCKSCSTCTSCKYCTKQGGTCGAKTIPKSRGLIPKVEAKIEAPPALAKPSASRTPDDKRIEVFFSPSGGCTTAIVDQLASARNTVFVQVYSFTSAPIAKALVDASKRGVKIKVVLDKSQRGEKYTSATFLANEGLPR